MDRTDVVTILWRRSTTGRMIIAGFCVIGSAFPCRRFLIVGGSTSRAVQCLLSNGFTRIHNNQRVMVFKRITK